MEEILKIIKGDLRKILITVRNRLLKFCYAPLDPPLFGACLSHIPDLEVCLVLCVVMVLTNNNNKEIKPGEVIARN